MSGVNTSRVAEMVLGTGRDAALIMQIDAAIGQAHPGGVLLRNGDRVIRFATPSDNASIDSISFLVTDDTTPCTVAETEEELECLHIVAEEGGVIIGQMYGAGKLRGKDKANIDFFIENVIVDVAYRGTGCGRDMGRAMISLVEQVRQEVGLSRYDHAAGKIKIDSDTRPDSEGQAFARHLKKHAKGLVIDVEGQDLTTLDSGHTTCVEDNAPGI